MAKSLSRKFGLRHVLKVAAESAKISAEEIKNIYLSYKFLGKSVEGKFEVYKATLGEKEIEFRQASTGSISVKGVFGYHSVEEFDNLLVSALI